MNNKRYFKKYIFAAVLLSLLISFQSFGQNKDFKNDFIIDLEKYDLDYSTRQQVWDAFFVTADLTLDIKQLGSTKIRPVGEKDTAVSSKRNYAYIPRSFAEKTGLLEELRSKLGSGSDISLMLATIYFRAGLNDKAMKMLGEYIADAESPESYIKAADFYYKISQPGKEIALIYQNLSEFAPEKKMVLLERIIKRIDDYGIRQDLRRECYSKLIETAEDKKAKFQAWFSALTEEKKYKEVEALISEYREAYPNLALFFRHQKAELLFSRGETEKAINIYYGILNPEDKDGNFNDYFNTLNRTKIFNNVRRSLFKKWKSGKAQTIDKIVLFRMYLRSGQRRQAANVLKSLMSDAKDKSWRSEDLKFLAVCNELIGDYREAVKMYYELFKRAGDGESRLRRLSEMEAVLSRHTGLFNKLSAPGAEHWFTAVTSDRLPSFFGGILSLLYNKQNISEKAKSLKNVYNGLSSKKVIFNLEKMVGKSFPASGLAGKLMLDRAEIYQDYGLWKKSADVVEDFMKKFPESSHLYTAADILIGSYDKLEDFNNVMRAYRIALSRARAEKDTGKYWSYFDKRIRWLTQNKRLTDAVNIYWDEIKRYPEDRELYDKFLSFVQRHRFFKEELRIYKQALKKFDQAKWSHKIARWYIRHRAWNDYRDFSENVVQTFSNSEVRDYLKEFERYVPGSNEKRYKRELYYNLYRYSLDRFPFNSFYLKGLLGYYRYYKKNNDYLNLAKRYFFINSECRKEVLSDYFKKGGFTPDQPAGETIPPKKSAEKPESYTDLIKTMLSAHYLSWFSYYEEAVDYYKYISAWYPDESSVVEYLASLHRSLQDTGEAVDLYKKLADRYPMNTEYLTLAGEVLADTYQMELAVKYWEDILKVDPADKNLYLDVATLFWDYYMFDRSEKTLLEYRKKSGNKYIFAEKLAAVYESAGNYKKAVEEYLNKIESGGYSYWQELDRLIYLRKARDLEDAIDRAFVSRLKNNPNNTALFRACSSYFERTGDEERLYNLYEELIPLIEERMLLSDIYYYFQYRDKKKLMGKVMLRKLEVSEDQPWILNDAISYFEDIKNYAQAERLIDRKLSIARAEADEFPNEYIDALNYAYRYYERNKKYDKAFEMLREIIDRSSGERRRGYQVTYAKLYIKRDQLEKAAEILKNLVKEYPDRIDYFNALADVYTKRKDFKGLVEFYTDALVRVKNAPMHISRKEDMMEQLRYGLIKSLEKLRRYPEAVDQYIEIINRNPRNESVLRSAYNFAEKHRLVGRLIDYYEATAKKSFKDYRWQVILAQLYTREDELAKAIDKYSGAIKNEPQMVDLYYSQVELYIRLKQYQQAAEVYEKIYELSEDNYDVLLKRADMLMRAGRKNDAVEIVRIIVKDNPENHQPYFNAAEKLESWGEYKDALVMVERGIEVLKQNVGKDVFSREHAELIPVVYFKSGKAAKAIFGLFELHSWLEEKHREAQRSRDWNARWQIENTKRKIYSVISGNLGGYCRNYASDPELRDISNRLYKYYLQNKKSRIDVVKKFAGSAGLYELEEKLIFDADRIYDSLRYFSARRSYEKMIKLLQKNLKSYSSSKSYLIKNLADLYRIMRNRKQEESTLLLWLQKRYARGMDWYFNNRDEGVERYYRLSLQKDAGNIATLYRGDLSRYVGNLINLLLREEEVQKAIRILSDNPMNRPDYWVLAKTAGVYRSFNKYDSATARGIEKMLNLEPVGNRIKDKKSPDMKSHVWYRLAGIYADFMSTGKQKDATDLYLPAIIEELPKSAEKQILTGDIYFKQGRYKEALEHYELALQLQPKNRLAITNTGKALNSAGMQDQALKMWKRILEPGRLSDYEIYAKVLIENGFPEEGVKEFSAAVKDAVDKQSNTDNIFYYIIEAGKYSARHNLPFDKEKLVRKLYNDKRNDFSWIVRVIENPNILPDAQKTFYYQKAIQLLERAKSTTTRKLKEWQRKYHDHLVSIGKLNEALDRLNKMASEKQNLNEIWILTEMVRLRNRLGRKPVVPSVVSEFVKKGRTRTYRGLLSVLRSEKLETIRNRYALEYYRFEVEKMKYINNANLYAYADELFVAGKIAEAKRVVNRLLTYRVDNKEGMRLAAEVLEKHKQYQAAVEVRNDIRKNRPNDFKNLLMLAVDLSYGADTDESLKLFKALLTDQSVGRKVRNDAAVFLIKEVDKKSGVAVKAADFCRDHLLKSRKNTDENIYMVAAADYKKKGNLVRATELLMKAANILVVNKRARVMLGEIFSESKKYGRAIDQYRAALEQDANDREILVALFDLYYKTGDYLKAIKTSEDYNYYPDLANGEKRKPDGFIPLHDSLEDRNDKIELLNRMITAALKIDSLSRARYYNSLMLPLVEDYKIMYELWKKREQDFERQYEEMLRKREESVQIRWEL